MKQACLYPAPFGNITLIFEGDDLVELKLHGNPAHAPYPLPDSWQQKLDAYFAGRLNDFQQPISPRGTPYQQKVWQAIAEIPNGEVMTYQDIARKIGSRPRRRRGLRQKPARTGRSLPPSGRQRRFGRLFQRRRKRGRNQALAAAS